MVSRRRPDVACLTPVLASGWPFPLLLIWLQLPIYMLHQYEEHHADRFRLFVNATIGRGKEVLSRFSVLVINIGGVWAVDAGAFGLAARVHIGLGLIAVYLSLQWRQPSNAIVDTRVGG